MEDDYYMDDMDMDMDMEMLNDNLYSDELTREDLMELLEGHDGELTPEMLRLLEAYQSSSGSSPLEYSRISVPELVENCMVPTCAQALQTLLPLFIMCLVFRLICQLSHLGKRETGAPVWLIHLSSTLFGIIVLNSFFKLTLLYLVACCVMSYLLFFVICKGWHQWCGLAGATFVVIFTVLCELIFVESSTWHKIRGAQIILSMKIISIGYDISKSTIGDLPNILEYTGYCFNVGTVIFGPWISYTQYYRLLNNQSNPMSMKWILQVFTTSSLAVLFLLYSNCLTHWLILDSVGRWMVAYRDAQSFRFSHFFISFLSDATASLSGVSYDDSNFMQWNVARPQHIEVPRSLVEVVTNWNLPMHYWLKTYVFKPVLPYNTFLAVTLTYAASSLLHGLNFQLAAVLFSLGFYSYTEYVFRRRLSQVFDACIQAKKCKEKCDHRYTSSHPIVFMVNLAFGALTVFHLAYLGLMFDSSDGEEKGYTMWHTLDKWSSLNFLSHWIALGTFLLYWLI